MTETTLAEKVDTARREQLNDQDRIGCLEQLCESLAGRIERLERQTGLDQILEKVPEPPGPMETSANAGSCAATSSRQLWP